MSAPTALPPAAVPEVRMHVQPLPVVSSDPPLPCCTCWDIPFAVGEAASLVGIGGSITLKIGSVAAAPYAGPAIGLFSCLFGVILLGHRRSRQNYQIAQRLVTKIERANVQLTNVATTVNTAVNTLSPLGKDWKQETDILLKEKAEFQKAQTDLTQLCAALQRENAELKTRTESITRSAADASMQVARLSTVAHSFDATLAAETATQDELKHQNTALAAHVVDVRAETIALAQVVVSASDLTKELKEPLASTQALQETQNKVQTALVAEDATIVSLQKEIGEKLTQLTKLEQTLTTELHTSPIGSDRNQAALTRLREEHAKMSTEFEEQRHSRDDALVKFERLNKQLAEIEQNLAKSPRDISSATAALDPALIHAEQTVNTLKELTAATQAQIDVITHL